MSKLDRAAARERCEAATPGPWRYDTYNRLLDSQQRTMVSIPDHPDDDGELYAPEQITERGAWYRESQNNIDFVQHARTDLPLALAGLDQQSALIAQQEQEIERLKSDHDDHLLKIRELQSYERIARRLSLFMGELGDSLHLPVLRTETDILNTVSALSAQVQTLREALTNIAVRGIYGEGEPFVTPSELREMARAALAQTAPASQANTQEVDK